LFRGELERAEQLMGEALQLGEASLADEADHTFRAHNFLLRREQGRFDELEPAMRRAAEEITWYPMFRCFLVEFSADLDRPAQARQLFDELVADDFAALLPRDSEWLVSATIVADVCGYLADTECAGKLYDKLLPVADLVVTGVSECMRGSVARPL